MSINFNSLPTQKPASTIPAGFYKATISKAEMRVSKNTGNEYLSLQYDLTDDKGHAAKLYDMQFDSEKEFLRYKLARFLQATGLTLEGSFELKDLCKLVVGRKLIVDVGIDPAKDGNPERNTVNSFDNEIYYPESAWAALTGATTPINAADALDAINAMTEESEEY